LKKTIENIHKWSRMLTGKSVFHMRQLAGLYYEKDSVKGYYSDLRHKVTGNTLLDNKGIPFNVTNQGKQIYFSITIFQYGLGAYDLYLETGKEEYLEKFNNIVSWALSEQETHGGWDTFSFKNLKNNYSSMAQGEGASLLLRAYLETKDEIYINAAKKAIDFMLLSVNQGGTTLYYSKDEFTFEESCQFQTILNGVIFSIWGLWDYVLVTKDENYTKILDDATEYLVKILPSFDRGYWSDYDLDGNITSPFYHDLHIQQLKVMYDLFGIIEFNNIQKKWTDYQKSSMKKRQSFVIKVIQKLKASKTDITLVH
jgi:heparosan-N-sulfate-glucuronate 5-epimerase